MQARRSIIVALAAATVTTAILATPLFDRLRGFSLDSLFWLRFEVFGPQQEPEDSHVVVVAIDEESYRRPPLAELPKVLWTPEFARVIEALLAADAKVIGQDIVLPTTAESFLPGRDRDYLLALRAGGAAGRIVLGRVQHLAKPLSPHPGQSFAVGPQNVRLLNLSTDGDSIVRRLPLGFEVSHGGETRVEPGFATELAARYLGAAPDFSDHAVRLGDRQVPLQAGRTMLLNFAGGGQAIPVYSFADILACSEAGETAFLAEHFRGKVVILGAALDKEDRILTSMRFTTAPDGTWFAPRCVNPVMTELYDGSVTRESIPGPFIFATAINNLVDGTQLRPAHPLLGYGAIWLVAVLTGLLLLGRRPWPAALLVGGLFLLWAAIATAAFEQRLVLPLYQPMMAAALTFAIELAHRYGLVDRQKRTIRRAFALYLPSEVIDQMTEEDRLPALGGETKELSVLFSDLAGFTSLVERMAPTEVVRFMNRYLTAMTEVIEDHGGFVDKYVGDAVIAVFGAPLDDDRHACQAVGAALACQERLAALRPEIGIDLRMRIGINSGPMLIGNIGSERRFNYTVMGDAVNLAARLETANKEHGTEILVSAATRAACGEAFAFREVGRISVKGREEQVTVFTPSRRPAAD